MLGFTHNLLCQASAAESVTHPATRRKLFLLNRTMPRETAAALMRIVSER